MSIVTTYQGLFGTNSTIVPSDEPSRLCVNFSLHPHAIMPSKSYSKSLISILGDPVPSTEAYGELQR